MTKRRPVEPIYQDIGQRVRQLRETHDLRQEDLAAATGLARTSISNLEAGRQEVPLPALWRIAERLETTVSALIGEAPMPPVPPDVVVKQYFAVWCAEHGVVADELDADDYADKVRREHLRQHLDEMKGRSS